MRSTFRFFRRDEHRDLEREFRACYQEPGINLLAIGFALAVLTFGVFYVLDYLNGNQPLIGGVQTFRLFVIATLALTISGLLLFRSAALRNYTATANITIFAAVQAAAYVACTARLQTTYVELYWALTSSMVTATICVFAFSRLTAANTLLLALTGTVAAILYAFHMPEHPAQLARLATHLAVATVVCYLLRYTIQSRERQLFLSGKEMLERNRYTQQLEIARLAAEQADQAKARFLANMSHEVRTPMNALLQILEIVAETSSAESRRMIARGRTSGQALLRILNTILDYAKLTSGRAALSLTPVDLRAAAKTVLDLYLATAASKGIALKTDFQLQAGCEMVLTDEVKLLEILGNLVSNAVKFTSSGHVEIFLSSQREASAPATANVIIRVRDTGCGIAGEHMSNLFTPFFQVRDNARMPSAGTGLGLSIVKELTTMLGGTVDVASTYSDGAAFTVTLNLKTSHTSVIEPGTGCSQGSLWSDDAAAGQHALADHDGADRDSGRTERPRLTRGRAMLVEDNELNAELATLFLTAAGFSVVLAENGVECLDHFSSGPFDVVLMDCFMPVMDGFEATQQIRAMELAQGVSFPVPIIGLTANTLIGNRERCLACGMSDFLGKPYSRAELHAVLDRWVPARTSFEGAVGA